MELLRWKSGNSGGVFGQGAGVDRTRVGQKSGVDRTRVGQGLDKFLQNVRKSLPIGQKTLLLPPETNNGLC